MIDGETVHLFSYGTLQQPSVQQVTFGRLLDGTADAMLGYTTSLIEITDPDVLAASKERFHPIVVPSTDPDAQVQGMVFTITPAELRAADEYEVSDYRRVPVRLKSGIDAWVYVKA